MLTARGRLSSNASDEATSDQTVESMVQLEGSTLNALAILDTFSSLPLNHLNCNTVTGLPYSSIESAVLLKSTAELKGITAEHRYRKRGVAVIHIEHEHHCSKPYDMGNSQRRCKSTIKESQHSKNRHRSTNPNPTSCAKVAVLRPFRVWGKLFLSVANRSHFASGQRVVYK